MKKRTSRVLAVLLTTSVILSVGVLAAPYAIRENDTIGLILFTSDRANPSTRGMCGNCEDIYVMPPATAACWDRAGQGRRATSRSTR